MSKSRTRKVIIHLISALITASIAFWIGKHLEEGKNLISWVGGIHEELPLLVLIASSLALFLLFAVIDDILNYFWFLFTSERKACGLFIEAYLVDEIPRLGLMVVYFGIHDQELKV